MMPAFPWTRGAGCRAALAATVLCCSSSACNAPLTKAASSAISLPPARAPDCRDSLADVFERPAAALPPLTPDQRGAIVRCAEDTPLSRKDLNALLTKLGFRNDPVPSGARVLRIAYRTERGAAPREAQELKEGISSAIVLLPDAPIVERPPIVVVAHGSTGIGPSCSHGHGGPTQLGIGHDAPIAMYLSLVGYGYPVIAPDYAGFGYGSTPGWTLAGDV